MIFAHVGMLSELAHLYARPYAVLSMYISSVLTFSIVYFTFFCMDTSSFAVDGYAPVDSNASSDIDDSDVQTTSDIPSVMLFFAYFSMAIQTTTGFGDIAPTLWYAEVFTNLQMITALCYHVGVFGLTIAHFRSFQQKIAALTEAERAARKHRTWIGRTRCAQWLRSKPWFERLRAFVLRYLVLISFAYQLIYTSFLLSEPEPFLDLWHTPAGAQRAQKAAVLAAILLLMSLQCFVLLLVSMRLVHKITHREIALSFLVQSYLATSLLFGALYFLLFAATPSHEFSRAKSFDDQVFDVSVTFMYFSLTVMTGTGFGDVYARGLAARLCVMLEMIISTLYNFIILGLGMAALIEQFDAIAEKRFKEQVERLKEGQQMQRIVGLARQAEREAKAAGIGTAEEARVALEREAAAAPAQPVSGSDNPFEAGAAQLDEKKALLSPPVAASAAGAGAAAPTGAPTDERKRPAEARAARKKPLPRDRATEMTFNQFHGPLALHTEGASEDDEAHESALSHS
jgi:hypothetical protein